MSRIYGTITLDRQARTWRITTSPDCMTRLKRIFERVPKESQGTAPLADSPSNAVELEWLLIRFPHEMSAEDRAYLAARAEKHRARERVIERVLAPDYKPREFKLLKPLREYQALAVDLCIQSSTLLVADDMGLGKTIVGCGLISDPRTLPALVICPTHLPTHWERKIAEFLGPSVLVHILQKGKPYDAAAPAGGIVEKCGRIPDVIICNYVKLNGWAMTLAEIVKSIIADEAQEFRHHETKKYEAIQYLRDRTDFRLFLTGTPIYNYGNEIHTVISALREDALGTREEFGREWCGGATGRKAKVEDTTALNAFLTREGLMLRRRRKEVGRELPALTNVVQVVDTSGECALDEAEASIAEMAEILLAEGGKGIDKMQAARDVDILLRQATGIDKAPFAARFIRMLCAQGEKVLVFAWHRAVYDILLEKLGPGQQDDDEELPDLHPVLFTGTENAKKKDESRERFINGDAQVMLMSLRAGTGVDGLQDVSATTVFVELDWSPQVMNQDVCRIHRDGQKRPVFSYVLVSEEGSDPIVADVLGMKAGQFEGIFNPSEELAEVTEVPVDRVKQLAAGYLAQRKAKRENAPPPNPKAQAPVNLRPEVKPPPVQPKPPAPPPKPAPQRWVPLLGRQIDGRVEKMLFDAGIGVTANTIALLRAGQHRALVGFHGQAIVACKVERI